MFDREAKRILVHFEMFTSCFIVLLSGDCQPGAGQSAGTEGNWTSKPVTLHFLSTRQASLELAIESLVEQATSLHTLYARQDELLKRSPAF